ncbi:MAG: nodulation protein NodN [Alphaproteobacteria bacterium]|nr:MAG: nodulation protein NodN [Alphaproteobacteria bacterium]
MDLALRDPFGELKPGSEIGVSHWVEITQRMIDGFGEVTLDADPMHIDPEWARTKGPFGHTVAFGFLTMSLLTNLLHDAMRTDSAREPAEHGYYLNYGFDRLRLVAPVPVNARVRGRFVLLARERDEKNRFVSRVHVTIEVEGSDRPALIAEWLTMWVPPGA